MPEKKQKLSLNPDFDPRSNVLPEIPEEIKELRRKEINQRRNIIIALAIFITILIGSLMVWGFMSHNNNYHYVKLISNASNEKGASIDALEVKIKNLSYYADKVTDASQKIEKDKILGKPTENGNNYVNIGKQGEYIVVKFKVNLKDENATSLIIHEANVNNTKQPYSVFIGPSNKGPWDYLGKKAGTAIISLRP